MCSVEITYKTTSCEPHTDFSASGTGAGVLICWISQKTNLTSGSGTPGTISGTTNHTKGKVLMVGTVSNVKCMQINGFYNPFPKKLGSCVKFMKIEPPYQMLNMRIFLVKNICSF